MENSILEKDDRNLLACPGAFREEIKRRLTWAFRQQEQKYRGPHQVHGPVFRVDKDLDHESHAEERQGREPRRQADNDQRRA